MAAHLSEVLAGHLRQHGVEVLFVLVVDESIVEHSHGLVAEQAENLLSVADTSRVCLEQAWKDWRKNSTQGKTEHNLHVRKDWLENSNQGKECKTYIIESILVCISLICIEQTLDKL